MAKQVTRWVCDHCKGVWFRPSADGRCPSCSGTGREMQVTEREDGSIVVTD